MANSAHDNDSINMEHRVEEYLSFQVYQSELRIERPSAHILTQITVFDLFP